MSDTSEAELGDDEIEQTDLVLWCPAATIQRIYHPTSRHAPYSQLDFNAVDNMGAQRIEHFIDRRLRDLRLLEKARTPVGQHGDYAFRGGVATENHMEAVIAPYRRSLKNRGFLPVQTEAFFHLPRELRDMVYSVLLEPFRNDDGEIFLRLHRYSKFRAGSHPGHPLYDVELRSPREVSKNAALFYEYQAIEALRNFSNTHSQIRHEIGELFWRDIRLETNDLQEQNCLPLFFQGRPAITHLSLLDLGGFNSGWGFDLNWIGSIDRIIRSRIDQMTDILLELAVLNVTFDYIAIDVLVNAAAPAQTVIPEELRAADIVDVLSSPDVSVANNLEIDLKKSKHDWINALRKLSTKIKKRLCLTVVGRTSRFIFDTDGLHLGEWTRHDSLLEWHLCPGKRPTFLSILGAQLPLPHKKGRDMFYPRCVEGKKPDAMKGARDGEVIEEDRIHLTRKSLFGRGDEPIKWNRTKRKKLKRKRERSGG